VSPCRALRGRPERGLEEPRNLYVHIGRRLRERRISLALSGPQLGELAGVSGYQIYQYELGRDRIWAGLLHALAGALQVPVTFFFEGMDGEGVAFGRRDRRLLEFMRNVAEISDEDHLAAILEVVRLLAANGMAKQP